MTDASVDVRLERLAEELVSVDAELASSLRTYRQGTTDGTFPPERWFEHLMRLPEAVRDRTITVLADQSEPAFLSVTMAIAAEAPLPYHRVFALKRLPRFPVPEVRILLERLHREGRGPDYGPYFASILRDIDPDWATALLASPSAARAPARRPRKADTEDEEWPPDSRGIWPTILITAIAVLGVAASIAWALRLLPRWVP